MELKQGVIIGAVVFVLLALFGGVTAINVNGAIERCDKAGYEKPDFAFSVTSCKADDDYASDNIALVVANTANTPSPVLTDTDSIYLRNSLAYTDGMLKPFIYSAVPGGQQISYSTKKIKPSHSVSTFISDANKRLDTINKTIGQPASDDSVDYFNNIQTAASAVKSSNGDLDPIVLVIGSGLSDTQPLNFADNDLLHTDPNEILTSLKTSNTISANSLSGVRIIWSGMGVTASPQQPLDSKEKTTLKNIYQKIFEYMGATLIVDDTVLATDSVITDARVKVVPVDGLKGGPLVLKLGENSIGFNPGGATINDPVKANIALAGVVTNYQICPTAVTTIE